jgi:ADP-ribose pyrophosphatase YjhB (NUDIX family)
LNSDDLRQIAHFEQHGIYFHYRVAGVAIDDDRVLLHRTEIADFWSLPGGHVILGETAEQALRRELLEELDAPVDVGRLLWVVENFFDYSEARHHELGLYFRIDLGADSPFYQMPAFAGAEGSLRIEFRWFPRQDAILAQLPLLPSRLQRELPSLPATPRHLVEGWPTEQRG